MKITDDYLKIAGDPPKVPEALSLLQRLSEMHNYYQKLILQNEDLTIVKTLDSVVSSVKRMPPEKVVDNSEESYASSVHMVGLK